MKEESQKKSNDEFKKAIEYYLDYRAMEDPTFAPALNNPKKNIDECVKFILGVVSEKAKSWNVGTLGFTDEEIFSLAVHYYDEPNVEIKDAAECMIAVNYRPELTDKEKEEAKERALREYQQQCISQFKERDRKLTQKKEETKKENVPVQQSLF